MTAETSPRDLIGTRQHVNELMPLGEQGITSHQPLKQTSRGSTGTRIRIHKDNLLIAECQATGLGPGRLFVSIDPLNYPVNSQLSLEFVNTATRGAKALLSATVTARSVDGIELRLDPAPV